jgi:hypothetical protein
MNKLTLCLLFCLFSAGLFCLSSPVFAQIGFGWEIGDGFTTGLYSNITISDITYTSTIAGAPSTFSASANSTATVTHYMWSSNISGSFVNGSWTAWTANPITYTATLGESGTINTIILYVNDSAGTVGSNSVSVTLQNVVVASAGTGVNLSPVGAVVVDYGSSQTFTYTPVYGYRISSVVVDGVAVSLEDYPNSYTFSDIVANHTIAVYATTSLASQSAATTFSAAFNAISLIGVALIVSAATLIISAVRSGEEESGEADPKVVLAGIVLVVVGIVMLIVSAVILGYFEAAVNLT